MAAEGIQVKREDKASYTDYRASTSIADMTSSTSSPYPGPAPAHSQYAIAPVSARKYSGPAPPDEFPRQSEDERNRQPIQRQSLPSIHEALGTSQPTSYPGYSYQSAPPPPPPPPHRHSSPPREPVRLPPYESHPSVYSAQPAVQPLAPSYASRPPTPPTSTTKTHPPSLHPITTSPRQHDARSSQWGPSHMSPHDQQVSGSTEASSQRYPQSHPPTSYAPAPTSGQAPTPVSQYQADPYRYNSTWRTDPTAPAPVKSASVGSNIGDSVKRHLEAFDLESSLNEISDSSKQLWEFSGHYAQRAHETQRSGPLPGSTPHLSDIDKMMKNSHRIQESLTKLRDVVTTHQAALIERSREQIPKPGDGHADARSHPEDTRGGGGFAGADPKKRRGRAAPPGNCHSCNRSETPEWRRGPDGARTLCNACGLHYAKLTRKMGTNKTGANGFNLRPKDAHTDF